MGGRACSRGASFRCVGVVALRGRRQGPLRRPRRRRGRRPGAFRPGASPLRPRAGTRRSPATPSPVLFWDGALRATAGARRARRCPRPAPPCRR
ncbi:MAG: hypothetical protein FJ137_04150 [Deltaproteobacteria bacterium]|nr:hypothetical protein [Deltaproteobacteria bacterium]